jgi:AraC-like DNA-binding protein
MIFKLYQPPPPLGKYVHSMVFYEGYNPQHSMEKLLPDGTVNLLIELDGMKRYVFDNELLVKKVKCVNAWVSGMQKDFLLFSAQPFSRMMVIQFKAGGSFPFLKIPLSELNNLVVEAELLFGREILDLREQLFPLSNPFEMFLLVEKWLIRQAKYAALPEAVVDFSVSKIQGSPTLSSLKNIADKTGYSQKQFIHIFKKHVGLTPKLYQRIARFNSALEEIEKHQSIDWSRISFDCGFYDQAHFINEFKKFSGLNPSDYLTERGEYLNYIPLFVER